MLLAASIAALLIGPFLFQVARTGPRALGFLEGFTFITIAGLLCFSILPHAIAGGGKQAWVFAALGLVFPVALERVFSRLAREVHLLTILLGVAGLAVHAIIDGVALGVGDVAALADWLPSAGRNEGKSLALAVVLHRFPVGLAIWYLLAPALGNRMAITVLILMIAGTMLGFMLAGDVQQVLSGPGLAWFQAFVAGSILHVIIYEPGHHRGGQASSLEKWPDRIGLVCGLVLLYVYL